MGMKGSSVTAVRVVLWYSCRSVSFGGTRIKRVTAAKDREGMELSVTIAHLV